MPPALDPLFAALPQTMRTWHTKLSEPFRVVHDNQAALTRPRVEAMLNELRSPHPEFASFVRPTPVIELTQVDSLLDERVQLADVLAGVARDLAESTLAGGTDTRAELIRPFVDLNSLWSDVASWQKLAPEVG